MSVELLNLARTVGLEAAAFVRERRPAGRVQVADTKSSATDAVTQIDRDCESLIRDRLLSTRPDDGFLGEESDDIVGTSGVDWVVDPIDGTVNFIYGLPSYAVSIGVRIDAEVVAGYVVNIASGVEWGAIKGEGSWRYDGENHHVLRGPTVTRIDQALVATGFNYVPEVRAQQGAAVAKLLPQVRDIRRVGSAALDLCALAEGHYDCYTEQGLHPWDLAPGGLIASEAGLILAGVADTPDERLVMAAPPAIAREYFDLVRACGF